MTAQAAQSTRHGKRALSRLDRRTYSGRRAKALTAIFADALGGVDTLTELQLLEIESAAELEAAAQSARADYLRGRHRDEARVVRLANAAARAKRALKLDAPPSQAKPSLSDYIKSKQTAADALTAPAEASDTADEPPRAAHAAGGQGRAS